jgi:hypothetical protein
MDPAEIWRTIVKADELLKYATEEKGEVRREQAERLLRQALEEARSVDNAPLVEQARRRLADLGVADV